MKNIFGWMQLQTNNPQKEKSFYGELFDWQFDTNPMPDDSGYIEVDAGNGPCAGISKDPHQNQWIPFVHVKSIKEFTEKAERLGAKVIVPPTSLGENQGFYSVFIDPLRATLGLYEPPQ